MVKHPTDAPLLAFEWGPESGRAVTSSGDALPARSTVRVWVHAVAEDYTFPVYSVDLVIEVVDGDPIATSVAVKRANNSRPLGNSFFRGFDIDWLVRQVAGVLAVKQYRLDHPDEESIFGEGFPSPGAFDAQQRVERSPRRRSVTPELLAEVAAVYAAAADGGAPTGAVKDHFHTSGRNAARWVSRAADAGMLPKTGKGKVRRADGER